MDLLEVIIIVYAVVFLLIIVAFCTVILIALFQEHILPKFYPESRHQKYIKLEEKKFAEGRFRNAIMGTWVKLIEKHGQKCVAKNKKDSCSWSLNDWNTTLKIVKKAKELSRGFNYYSSTSRPIYFVDVEIFKVVKSHDSHDSPELHECVTIEKYLPGEFKKWCNNYGYISSDSSSLPAFMHWSWVHTEGMLMIGDLQGVKNQDGYVLTDPVIMSVKGEYGATDTGVEGMLMFFLHHECNGFCKDLPRPDVDEFLENPRLPRCEVQAWMDQETANSTSYTYEMKFSAEIRLVIVQIFQSTLVKRK